MMVLTVFRKNITACLPSLPMIAELIEFQAMMTLVSGNRIKARFAKRIYI
jgi:hypothetical protein